MEKSGDFNSGGGVAASGSRHGLSSYVSGGSNPGLFHLSSCRSGFEPLMNKPGVVPRMNHRSLPPAQSQTKSSVPGPRSHEILLGTEVRSADRAFSPLAEFLFRTTRFGARSNCPRACIDPTITWDSSIRVVALNANRSAAWGNRFAAT